MKNTYNERLGVLHFHADRRVLPCRNVMSLFLFKYEDIELLSLESVVCFPDVEFVELPFKTLRQSLLQFHRF